MEIDKAVEEALQAKSEGVKTIKLKCGIDPQRDLELVKQIRRAIGPDLNICTDANQGYPTAKAAVKITQAMEEHNLLYMEQPVEGLDAMAEVGRRVDTPIMADENAAVRPELERRKRCECSAGRVHRYRHLRLCRSGVHTQR